MSSATASGWLNTRDTVAGETPEVVLVEPYLSGTSARLVADTFPDLPHRLLALGVGREELRRYGQPEDHVAAHGLDAAGLRRSITSFVAGRTGAEKEVLTLVSRESGAAS